MTTPSQEFPQRRSILKSENSLGACRAILSGAVVQADKDKYFDLISLAEHESILAERILDGYEWTRKQLEKHDAIVAEKDAEIAELKSKIGGAIIRIGLDPDPYVTVEKLESRAQKLVEALETIDSGYVPEGQRGDCPGCDYDGVMPDNLKHVDGCVYLVAHNAITKWKAGK